MSIGTTIARQVEGKKSALLLEDVRTNSDGLYLPCMH